MAISTASFRDKMLESFAVFYDWVTDSHAAEFTVRATDGASERFRIVGLSEINVSEDFRHTGHIAFCSLILNDERIYLSLDPFNEGVESDRDNFSFVGRGIIKLA